MIYINKLTLPSLDADNINNELNFVHKSAYPFHVLSYRGLFEVEFDDITIITGGNGSGKSTLLNVIAQKLGLRRPTPFNKTEYFDHYLRLCSIKLSDIAYQLSTDIKEYGRIITSDEVFDHLIDTRLRNDEIDDRRKKMCEEIDALRKAPMQTFIDFSNPDSIRSYSRQSEARRKTKSKYIKDNLGFNVAENSNGESAFKFFTDAIRSHGLYLLDEPENSLSAEKQIDLSQWIASMSRYERCQFIISTHSPFLMSTPGAKLYNLDVYPASTMKWTEVASVKTFYNFFKEHEEEF